MDALYLSADVDQRTTLCIAPLTKRKMAACGHGLDDSAGYFLFEQRHGDREGIEILARIESEEAAVKLASFLQLT